MKKTLYILMFLVALKISNAQTNDSQKTTLLLEYTLNPDKPKRKPILKDTFLIIKSEPNTEINFQKYDLKIYDIKIRKMLDTSMKPVFDSFIRSYKLEISYGKKFYRVRNSSETPIVDSTYITYGFCFNFENKATYMKYYYTFDKYKRLVQYSTDCYAQIDYIEYDYSDDGQLLGINDDDRCVKLVYEGKVLKKIYSLEWDSEKKKYYPVSFIEIKVD